MVVLNFHEAEELVEVIHWIHQQGWSPATSTNYSFRNTNQPLSIAISQSGIDKSKFEVKDFMLVDENGIAIGNFQGKKSSAETLLHTVLYQESDTVEVILHTHSIYGTILSQKYLNNQKIILKDYEVLKGLKGISTHATSVELPIFENTQNIPVLSEKFRKAFQANPTMPGYLIAGHGLYTWGDNLKSAKRQLEVLEFLLECEYRKLCWA